MTAPPKREIRQWAILPTQPWSLLAEATDGTWWLWHQGSQSWSRYTMPALPQEVPPLFTPMTPPPPEAQATQLPASDPLTHARPGKGRRTA